MRTIKTDSKDVNWGIVSNVLTSKRYTVFKVENQNWIGIYDNRKHTFAISRCHPDDVYDYRIGLMVAWCKLKNLKIPKFTVMEQLFDMKINTLFCISKCTTNGKPTPFYFVGADAKQKSFIVQRKDDRDSGHTDEYYIINKENKDYYSYFEILQESERKYHSYEDES